MTQEDILSNRIVVHGITDEATIRVTWCAKSIDRAVKEVREAFETIHGVALGGLKLVHSGPAFEQDVNGELFFDFTVDVDVKLSSPSICLRTGVIQSALEVYHKYLYGSDQ